MIAEYVEQDNGITQYMGIVYENDCFTITVDYDEDDSSFTICLWRYDAILECEYVYTLEAIHPVVNNLISKINTPIF